MNRSVIARSLLPALVALLSAGPSRADDDPHKGNFTLKDATKGLKGSGALQASIETSKGTFTCDLFADKAPKTVANFVGLARGLRSFRNPDTGKWEKKAFYDGLIFHRVIPGFMIQGGDAAGNGTGVGAAGHDGAAPGYAFEYEDTGFKFDKPGRLAMANKGARTPTNGTQFFITEEPKPNLNDGYTIFGDCEPVALVAQIARVPRGERDKPTEPVVIKKVTVAYKNAGSGKAAK